MKEALNEENQYESQHEVFTPDFGLPVTTESSKGGAFPPRGWQEGMERCECVSPGLRT